MVEHTLVLDSVFGSLSDPTRRDILKRVAKEAMTVSEIARPYKLTFAAISKHLKVLEKAKLIIKHRHGKEQLVQLDPVAFKDATNYLRQYQEMWEGRFNALEEYLNKEAHGKAHK